jgi:hypothetical protein
VRNEALQPVIFIKKARFAEQPHSHVMLSAVVAMQNRSSIHGSYSKEEPGAVRAQERTGGDLIA